MRIRILDFSPMQHHPVHIPALFTDDILRFAEDAAERCRRDHESFQADRMLHAFDRIDRVYA